MIYKRNGHWHLDATVSGVRYREALNTTDKREAKELEKDRITAIKQGKGASKTSRDFARKSFTAGADQYLEERKPHVAERTHVLERNLLSPLRKFFGEKAILRIKAEDISAYQRERRSTGIKGRTLNMEVGVLRRLMKRGKIWSAVAEDVKTDRENAGSIAKVLAVNEKKLLFRTAATKDEWIVVYCAAIMAVNTTCRGVELKHLRWSDCDLFERSIIVRRSKTQAGHRTIPLNADAITALARLRKRAETLGADGLDHFVFPACERNVIDPTRPQKTWRTAWRSLVREAAKCSGREAARSALDAGKGIKGAIAAWKRAAEPLRGLRFHDLRHQAITELAESGAPDATLMALAGHLSREMMEHYSHVRMAVKRTVLDKLETGLMDTGHAQTPTQPDKVN